MKARFYINGIGIISPQRTFEPISFLETITPHTENVLRCITPEFKEYINPIQLRRLSRMLRIGLSAAVLCHRDSKGAEPTGIITGTGYGFLQETAKFLEEIYQYDEQQLTPTFFMQSTYNALAGLVALTFKCKGYNNTHVNRGFAFETALIDAMMHLRDDETANYWVGAFDETDAAQFKIHSQIGYYRKENTINLTLFDQPGQGTLQGEGAAFFAISGERRDNTWCELVGVKTLFKPTSESIDNNLVEFLACYDLTSAQIDVVIRGVSGDEENDALLATTLATRFPHSPDVRFKHLCGEFCTATSFATWIGASILKKHYIPDTILFSKTQTRAAETVLIINQYMGQNISFILLRRW